MSKEGGADQPQLSAAVSAVDQQQAPVPAKNSEDLISESVLDDILKRVDSKLKDKSGDAARVQSSDTASAAGQPGAASTAAASDATGAVGTDVKPPTPEELEAEEENVKAARTAWEANASDPALKKALEDAQAKLANLKAKAAPAVDPAADPDKRVGGRRRTKRKHHKKGKSAKKGGKKHRKSSGKKSRRSSSKKSRRYGRK